MTRLSTRLRVRLVVIALVIVLPAVAVIVYDQSVQRRQSRQRAVQETVRSAHLAADQQAAVFDGVQRLLLTLARFPGLRGSDPAACLATLPDVKRDHPMYLGLWVDNADGSQFCSASTVTRTHLSRGRSWFERALSSRTISAGDYQIGLTTKKPEIVLAQPLLDHNGQVERVLAVAVGLNQLNGIAARTKIPKNATLTLADRNGTILARYPDSAASVGARQPALFHGDSEQLIETNAVDGVERLYAVVPVNTELVTGLYVTMGIEPSAIFAENNQLLRQHLWLLGLVALISVGVALVVGQILVLRPVGVFRDVTKRLASGDFTARAHLAGGPVISDLSNAIDAMAVALESHQRQSDAAERALRDAEERMRFALDAADVGIWEADLKTGASFWSERCEAMHGLSPGSFGKTLEAFLECVVPDDRDMVRQSMELAIHDHRDTVLEYRAEWPDESTHRIVVTGRFTYDTAGVPLRGAGIAVDVTGRRSLEEQLRQSQKMEAIGQLAGGIAHDFNNMLMAILGNAEFVQHQLPADSACASDVAEILKAGRRAAALTHQLLAFSRKQILDPRVLHVGDVIRELVPMLRRLLGETVDLNIAVSDQGCVKADPGQLEQVLVNLAVNARDAMPNGGRLTIESADVNIDEGDAKRHPTLRPGRHILLVVRDTGCGMDAATQKRLFEPFFTTKPKGEGTGLGLATAYGIVKQSEGHIWVESEPGHGTTFRICLPRTEEPEPAPIPAPAPAASPGGVETILLVEDESVVRELVFKILTRSGYTVHAMADPKAAIAFAKLHYGPIDLILSDVVLPDMSGRAMADLLQPQHPEARVLYMSGYTDDAIVDHGVLDPEMWFMQKPFNADALLRKVRDVLSAEVSTL